MYVCVYIYIYKNIEVIFLDMGLCNEFLGFTPKAKATTAKINKWDHIQLQTKEHQQNQMATYGLRENISKSHI